MSLSEITRVEMSAEIRVWCDTRDEAETIAKAQFREEMLPEWFRGSITLNNPGRMDGPDMDTTRWSFRVSAEDDFLRGDE